MPVQVPQEYIVSVDDRDWKADYVGSGRALLHSAGIQIRAGMAQFKVPEGTLVVAAPGEACVLVSASPDRESELDAQDDADYHLFRLIALGRLR